MIKKVRNAQNLSKMIKIDPYLNNYITLTIFIILIILNL